MIVTKTINYSLHPKKVKDQEIHEDVELHKEKDTGLRGLVVELFTYQNVTASW